jgi:hypothetical protein
MRSASFTGAFYSQVMDFTVDSVRTAAISYMYFATPLVICTNITLVIGCELFALSLFPRKII